MAEKSKEKRIGETKMHKYKVALTVGNILTTTYTVKAFSYKHAVYKAKFIAYVEYEHIIFTRTYVEKVKGGMKSGRN